MKSNFLFLLSCVFSYFLWRRERSKDTIFSYFLAQKEAKTSTPTKSPPILGDLTQENAETDIFLPFWYRGTRDEFFIGWRMEGAGTRLVLFIGWRIENGQKCLEGHIGDMGPGK